MNSKLPLSPPPPHGETCQQKRSRQEELAAEADPIKLRTGHIDLAIFRRLRPNGNPVFIRRKPIHRVQSKITIAIESDERICNPGRTANDDEASLRIFFPGFV